MGLHTTTFDMVRVPNLTCVHGFLLQLLVSTSIDFPLKFKKQLIVTKVTEDN